MGFCTKPPAQVALLARGCLGSAAPAEPPVGSKPRGIITTSNCRPALSCCPLGRHCWQACSLLGTDRVTAGDEGHESLGCLAGKQLEGDPCGLGAHFHTRAGPRRSALPSWRKHKQGRIKCLGLCKTCRSTLSRRFPSPLGGQWVQGSILTPKSNSHLVFLLLVVLCCSPDF